MRPGIRSLRLRGPSAARCAPDPGFGRTGSGGLLSRTAARCVEAGPHEKEDAPDLFDLDDFGYAAATGDGTVEDPHVAAARRAAAECPAAAVRLLS
ncbi:MAG: 4Fe-4S single cluster domain [Streptomyces sp.]|jgi:ferredoxin|nr:4Fe-4S single cluster domain [Streptomyces sp.]